VRLATGNPLVPAHNFDAEKTMLSSLKPIQINSEQKSLYSYSLNDKYTLRPLSSIRLSFIDITLKYQFYYKALTTISVGSYQNVFERNYDVTPDQFMPAGVITLRDNQLLVGQASLPDIPKNSTYTFSVGQDSDVRYLVKGNLTSKTDEKALVSLETYQLDVQIRNFKDKNISTQFVLQQGLQLDLISTTCKSINVQGNQLNLLAQLKQGENLQCKINVTVRLT
jgi:hypothetical protein